MLVPADSNPEMLDPGLGKFPLREVSVLEYRFLGGQENVLEEVVEVG